MTAWYCLKSRDELFTAEMLRTAGYVAYVPCEVVKKRRGRIDRTFSRPLAPGYLFVRCSPEALAAVRGIGASTDFVRAPNDAGVFVPIRLAANALVPLVIAELCGDFDTTREPPAWEPGRGDRIRLTKTKWAGYVGEILSVGRRGKLLIQLPGWKIEVGSDGVELAA